MLKRSMFKATAAIFIILAVGVAVISAIVYNTYATLTRAYTEQITDLTADAVYNRIDAELSKPVDVSLTMADDVLLIDLILKETENPDDEEYIRVIAEYLNAYQKRYGYEAIFLATVGTKRFYTSEGIDRIIDTENPEEVWYSDTLENGAEGEKFNVKIDIDKVEGAERQATIFVNCIIEDKAGEIIGIVGAGYRASHLQKQLEKYEKEFDVEVVLVDENGHGALSSGEIVDNFAEDFDFGEEKSRWQNAAESGAKYEIVWKQSDKIYTVVQYIPNAEWYLIITHDTETFNDMVKPQVFRTLLIGAAILIAIIAVVLFIISRYNRRIIELTVLREREKKEAFRAATEHMYDNIYEMNITKNCAAGRFTEQYFESLGMPPDIEFDEAIKIIAKKQIKEEFAEGYVSTFCTQNVLEAFEKGISTLRYEFMITLDGLEYKWIRIDAYIYYSPEDSCVHMFTYRKNIDEEKRREMQISKQAEVDAMTSTLNKSTTQRYIEEILQNGEKGEHALFIIDIDNFKQVNDSYGHAFGDLVITEFASALKRQFRRGDIIGRIGGDEFAAFVPVPNVQWAVKKAQELSRALDIECSEDLFYCKVTASIGVAFSPQHGENFEQLYKNADSAMYQIKKRGKNNYAFYQS